MKYIIANWKMKLLPQQERLLANELVRHPIRAQNLHVSLNPSFLSLSDIIDLTRKGPYVVGAQDCFFEDSGAYTGEVSPRALRDMGCENIILGHSERRSYLGEGETIINKKVHAVLENHLIPVLCVGESKEARESGSQDHIVRRQVELCLRNIMLVGTQKLLIAYEPVWAIGTGVPAAVKDIVFMHQVIYHTLLDIFPKSIVANNVFVLYGGSVDAENISSFLKEDVIDGALVGSASINAKQFIALLERAQEITG